jgi:hypothetical protein
MLMLQYAHSQKQKQADKCKLPYCDTMLITYDIGVMKGLKVMGKPIKRYYLRDSETNELWCLSLHAVA